MTYLILYVNGIGHTLGEARAERKRVISGTSASEQRVELLYNGRRQRSINDRRQLPIWMGGDANGVAVDPMRYNRSQTEKLRNRLRDCMVNNITTLVMAHSKGADLTVSAVGQLYEEKGMANAMGRLLTIRTYGPVITVAPKYGRDVRNWVHTRDSISAWGRMLVALAYLKGAGNPYFDSAARSRVFWPRPAGGGLVNDVREWMKDPQTAHNFLASYSGIARRDVNEFLARYQQEYPPPALPPTIQEERPQAAPRTTNAPPPTSFRQLPAHLACTTHCRGHCAPNPRAFVKVHPPAQWQGAALLCCALVAGGTTLFFHTLAYLLEQADQFATGEGNYQTLTPN